MRYPNVNYLQTFDQNYANSGTSELVSGITNFQASTYTPGLLQPWTLLYGYNGLTVSITGNTSAFGVFFGGTTSGRFSRMHGTQTGQDTQIYSTSFASLVPASGSVTAYLVAQYQQIQQNPIIITGPPPGHPSFNPIFKSYVGYSLNVDTIALQATTVTPDNKSFIEIGRVVLSAGQVSITALDTTHAQVSSPINTVSWQPITTTSTYNIPASACQYQTVFQNSCGSVYLPGAGITNGSCYPIVNDGPSAITVATSDGTDIIGLGGALGQTSFTLQPFSTMFLQSYGVFFGSIGSNFAVPSPYWYQKLTNSSGNLTVPSGIYNLFVRMWGGGGGGAGGTDSVFYMAGGGGGGGYGEAALSVVPGQSLSYAIGAGGTSGASSGSVAGNPGGSGGTTSFGPYSVYGGLGGTCTNGGLLAPGAGGGFSSSCNFGMSGANGAANYVFLFPVAAPGTSATGSVLMPGGSAPATDTQSPSIILTTNQQNGIDGQYPGQGGGGGMFWSATAPYGNGGPGMSGLIIVIGY